MIYSTGFIYAFCQFRVQGNGVCVMLFSPPSNLLFIWLLCVYLIRYVKPMNLKIAVNYLLNLIPKAEGVIL